MMGQRLRTAAITLEEPRSFFLTLPFTDKSTSIAIEETKRARTNKNPLHSRLIGTGLRTSGLC